jgi:hypothetical protein
MMMMEAVFHLARYHVARSNYSRPIANTSSTFNIINKLNVYAAHQKQSQVMYKLSLENCSLQLNIRNTYQFFSMYLVCARFLIIKLHIVVKK